MIIVVYFNLIRIECGYVKQTIEQLMFLLALKFDTLAGIRMLEFGDNVFYHHQSMYDPLIEFYDFSYFDRPGPALPVKDYFIQLGINHTSIDYNGKNGALKLDCREDLYQIVNETFDVITNLGFSEHVGESDVESNLIANQYAAFKNFHNFGKIGTLYMHMVPKHFHWFRHGICDYDKEFFNELIRINKYEVVLAPTYLTKGNYRESQNMILTSFMKANDDKFMSFEEFKNLPNLRTKYEDWNIRTLDVTVNGDDGTKTSKFLQIDISKTSIEEEAYKFCSSISASMKDEAKFRDECTKLVVQKLENQGTDSQYVN